MTRTSSGPPALPRPTPRVTTYSLFANMSTLPTLTHTSMGHSTSRHLAVAKVVTTLVAMTGPSSNHAPRCFTIRCLCWRSLPTLCTLTPVLIPHSTAVSPPRICHRIMRRRMIFSSYILDKRSRISSCYPHFLFFSFGDPSGYDSYFCPQPITICDGIPGLPQSMKSFKFGSSVPSLAHLARDDSMSSSNIFGSLKGLGP
jgi:hypothetical protein